MSLCVCALAQVCTRAQISVHARALMCFYAFVSVYTPAFVGAWLRVNECMSEWMHEQMNAWACTHMDISKSLQGSALDRGYNMMTPIMDQNRMYSLEKAALSWFQANTDTLNAYGVADAVCELRSRSQLQKLQQGSRCEKCGVGVATGGSQSYSGLCQLYFLSK